MKMYPDSKLPLKPEGRSERFLLYMFEHAERSLAGQTFAFFGMLALWALTKSWFFGVLAALSLLHIYHGLEARAVSRMIRRASTLERDRTDA